MADLKNIRVAVNGYGVIGKRVAAAVAVQEDMSMAGVSDVVTDRRAHMVIGNGFPLFGATTEHAGAMRAAGLNVTGTLDELRRTRIRRGRISISQKSSVGRRFPGTISGTAATKTQGL
jgi:glyceraldehyde-3-phosphate dehydrogenase/erythrose-4-phosphate dehydrogenase